MNTINPIINLIKECPIYYYPYYSKCILLYIELYVYEIRESMNQNKVIVFTSSNYNQDLYNDLRIKVSHTMVDCR